MMALRMVGANIIRKGKYFLKFIFMIFTENLIIKKTIQLFSQVKKISKIISKSSIWVQTQLKLWRLKLNS